MKLIPRRNQIIGRMVIEKSELKIILIDETKVTKYLLVDAVGSEAAAAGIKVGDVVVPMKVGQMVLAAGTVFSPWLDEKDIGSTGTDFEMDDLLVQTAAGTRFVPFDSPEAAKPIGVSAPIKRKRKEEAA